MSLKNSNFEIIYVMGQTYTHFKVLFSLIKTMPSFWKSVKNWLKYSPLKFSNGNLQRTISQSIFDRLLKTWHRFNQGKEFFKMSISLDYYTFYFKIWVFKANNLSRFTPVPIWVRGPKIPPKVLKTNVGTGLIVIFEIIFTNDNTWLPPP